MKVQVAYADAASEAIVTLDVAEGCRVEDAVVASGILDRIGPAPDSLAYAVFGRRVHADARLSPGDRVELTRPLVCDAKAARRERAAHRKGSVEK